MDKDLKKEQQLNISERSLISVRFIQSEDANENKVIRIKEGLSYSIKSIHYMDRPSSIDLLIV